jgi:hypothetical protein
MIYNRPNKQPETAEYIEKMISPTLDEPNTYSGSVEFRFRQHTTSTGYKSPIPGLRQNSNIEYKIETNSNLPFKAGDIIRFGVDDNRKYQIKRVDYTEDKNDVRNIRRSYLYKNKDENDKFKIITLV